MKACFPFQVHSKSIVWSILVTVMAIATGCSSVLDLPDKPTDAQCLPAERRCLNNRPQSCMNLVWQDEDLCPQSAPVCTANGQCSSVTAVSAGGHHACALIEADGSLRCWGGNESGQLGNGSMLPVNGSVRVGDFINMKEIQAGGHDDAGFTCAIDKDAKAWCWGDNFSGQLGLDDKQPRAEPTWVEGISDVQHVSVGSRHTCAIFNGGKVNCWGWDTVAASNIPSDWTGLSQLPTIKEIAAGGRHTCAIAENGDVYCWGYNGDGQCGQPLTEEFVEAPKRVAGIANATVIAAGYFHTCALSKNEVLCWGRNDCGQLGRGTYCGSYCPQPKDKKACGEFAPAAVVTSPTTPLGLDLGGYHSCIIGASGTLRCWGRSDYEQAGSNGDPVLGMGAIFFPVSMETTQTHALTLSLGAYFGCITTDMRGTQCWGRNDHGQLGIDDSVQW
jgi:Regulator of chromosome condensation (RCC1) repeat